MAFNMHRTRRAARLEAWYGNEEVEWNPFQIRRTKSIRPQPTNTTLSPTSLPELSQNRDGRRSTLDLEEVTTTGPTLGQLSDPECDATETDRDLEKGGMFSRYHRKKSLKVDGDEQDDHKRKEKRWFWINMHLKHEPFTVRNQLGGTLFCSWINVLLVAVPVGFVLNYIHVNRIVIFFVNFIAILPMATILGVAMDELRLRTGDVLGALVYISFSNIVQVITSIFLLQSQQIVTLKTSLIGGMLTLTLLNNGFAFYFGGLRRQQQFYNTSVATCFNGLFCVSITSFVLPTASYYMSGTSIKVLSAQSRGMAVILIVIYMAYLYFELSTHKDIFTQESQKVPMRPRKNDIPDGGVMKSLVAAGGLGAAIGRVNKDEAADDELVFRRAYEDLKEVDEPQLHLYVCIGTLIVGTIILGFTTKFMTDSIESLVNQAGVPKDFIGMVLLPILSNDVMAIQCAMKDQMDLALQSALGKSLQTALVVTPVLVIVGWVMGIEEMNLLFDGFQVVALFTSILLAQNCILDGTSNWLKGAILTLTYVIIAVASFYQGTLTVP